MEELAALEVVGPSNHSFSYCLTNVPFLSRSAASDVTDVVRHTLTLAEPTGMTVSRDNINPHQQGISYRQEWQSEVFAALIGRINK